jgi:hypothetical protein
MTLPKQQGSKRRFFSYKPHIWRSPITEPWAPRLYFCTFGYGTAKGATATEAYAGAICQTPAWQARRLDELNRTK